MAARRVARHALLAVALVVGAWAAPVHAEPVATATTERLLDGFDDVAAWKPVASDGVHASVHATPGPHGPAMRLDFDLAGTAGYAAARRALPLTLPARYEISFDLRADAAVNAFQIKLVDASGDNVWWVNRPNFLFPREWERVTITSRQIQFAWGPTKDRVLREAASLEFVVAAGRGGGRGSVDISHLVIRALPPEPDVVATTRVTASSSLSGADAARALDGDRAT